MANVVIKRHVAAHNVDSLNRSVVATQDLENGTVFELLTRSTKDGEDEVWNATAPTTASTAMGLWMAKASEVILTKVGTGDTAVELLGVVEDPRNFVNVAGRVFSAFKPQAGDIIEMTLGHDTNKYLIPQDTQFTLTTNASDNANGFAMHQIDTGILHIGSAGFVKTPVKTYIYEVVRN